MSSAIEPLHRDPTSMSWERACPNGFEKLSEEPVTAQEEHVEIFDSTDVFVEIPA